MNKVNVDILQDVTWLVLIGSCKSLSTVYKIYISISTRTMKQCLGEQCGPWASSFVVLFINDDSLTRIKGDVRKIYMSWSHRHFFFHDYNFFTWMKGQCSKEWTSCVVLKIAHSSKFALK